MQETVIPEGSVSFDRGRGWDCGDEETWFANSVLEKEEKEMHSQGSPRRLCDYENNHAHKG